MAQFPLTVHTLVNSLPRARPSRRLKLLRAFSGHSMRAGYATTAGAHDEPAYRIQQRMRHKSADTTTGYIRAGEQWTKSGLKGLEF
jgi:hypothetical protein